MTPPAPTERLAFRRPEARDFDGLAAFLASPRARFHGGPRSRDQAWWALSTIIGHWALRGYGNFAVTLKGDDRCLGTMGPWFPEGWPEPELAWTIWDAADEGRGFAAEAVLAIRARCYAALGWTTAVSYIDSENARSIALAERLGARPDRSAPVPAAGQIAWRHPGPEALQ